MSDDAKRKVLARRATFVAAALAGVSSACGKEPATNPPCLSPMQPTEQDAGPQPPPPPQPCLSPVIANPPPPQTDAAAEPMPCLSVVAPEEPDAGKPKPPPPRPCLKIAPPKGSK